MIQIFLNKEVIKLDDKDRFVFPHKTIMNYIAFSIIWSFGANIHDNSRKAFQTFFRQAMETIDSTDKADLPEDDLYEYMIDTNYFKFESWNDLKPEFKYNKNVSFFNILVPTSDTVKYNFMIRQITSNNFNVLITGETGVGKTAVTRDYLMNAPEGIDSAFVNFSGKTTTNNVVAAFESKLESRRRDLLGAKPGKKMIFFVDDVNMP